jgi:Uma2 family endonuclease
VSTLPFVAEQRVVLDNISWSTYLAILNEAEGRRGRITFDNGVLEIMSPSKLHEKIKTLIARMVETYTEKKRVACESAGSTTFARADLQRAFEPDECYYFSNAAVVRGKDEIDLSVDPPPDLVIEVDISRSSLPKLDLYRALGVPEIWRYRDDRLRVFQLVRTVYVEAEDSGVLPGFPLAKVQHYLDQRDQLDESALIHQFRAEIQR